MSSRLERYGGRLVGAWRRRAVAWLKARIYGWPKLDAWLDRRLVGGVGPESPPGSDRELADARGLARAIYLRLFPERRLRPVVLAGGNDGAGPEKWLRILSPFPPEDGGGGSRPAQLARELERRGFAVDWIWALPMFPWPRLRSGAGRARFVSEAIEDAALRESRVPMLVCAPHPRLLDVVTRAPVGTRIVYDAFDRWDGALGEGWYRREREEDLLRRANALVASAASLEAELRRRTGREVLLLPNAVDLALFHPSPGLARPPDVRRSRLVVGYVGTLWGDWIDFGLIAELADRLPDATLHLVGPGPSEPPFRRANVHWLGGRPHAQIPAYIQSFDVAIIPFVESRLTEAVSPLKAYEYLAMGRPVVSTPLPELAGVPGVRIARGREFAAAVTEVATGRFDAAAVSRFVARQTWTERVDHLLPLLIAPADGGRRS